MTAKQLPLNRGMQTQTQKRKQAAGEAKAGLHRVSSRPLTLHRSHRVRSKLEDIRIQLNLIEDALRILDNLSVWLQSDDLQQKVIRAGAMATEVVRPELERAERIVTDAQQSFANSLTVTVRDEIAAIAAERLREPIERINLITQNILRNGGY